MNIIDSELLKMVSKKSLVELEKENRKLKTQLKEANSLIDYCLNETAMHICDKDKLREYKAKYKEGEK